MAARINDAVGSREAVAKTLPKSARKFLALRDIRPDEWQEFFPLNGQPWTEEDRAYLAEWWGKDDALSLAYALGRPPWVLWKEVGRMRKAGMMPPCPRSS